MPEIQIKFEMNQQQKQQAVEAVLADLPEWFGIPSATKAYIDAAAELPCWIARAGEEAIGFITLKQTSSSAAEIHCMGVKKRYHGQGIGTSLYQQLAATASQNYQLLQVKTVAAGHYPTYDQTIAFYVTLGFLPLEVFPTLWDQWNPCLILVKIL